MDDRARIAIVDDDESVRESLPDLLSSFGYSTMPFACAEDFLASGMIADANCLILDVAMPGMSGPELQRELRGRGVMTPIIFITAQSIERSLPELIRSEAVACLLKPFSEQAVLEAVRSALSQT